MLYPASATWGPLIAYLNPISLCWTVYTYLACASLGFCCFIFHDSRVLSNQCVKCIWLYVYFISDTRFGTRLRAPYSFHITHVYTRNWNARNTRGYSFSPFSLYLMHSFLEEYTCLLLSYRVGRRSNIGTPRSTIYLPATYVFTMLFVFVQSGLRAA